MDNATLKFVLAAALAVAILYFMRTERFAPYDESAGMYEEHAAYTPAGAAAKRVTKVVYRKPVAKKSPLLQASLQQSRPVNTGVAANLLPKRQADDGFGQFAPDPDALTGKNFVDASRWVSLGAMTSRRNINRDLRADIPIPKNNGISPWGQSSIDQQVGGKPLDCP
jgi:hypothetical protein